MHKDVKTQTHVGSEVRHLLADSGSEHAHSSSRSRPHIRELGHGATEDLVLSYSSTRILATPLGLNSSAISCRTSFPKSHQSKISFSETSLDQTCARYHRKKFSNLRELKPGNLVEKPTPPKQEKKKKKRKRIDPQIKEQLKKMLMISKNAIQAQVVSFPPNGIDCEQLNVVITLVEV
jgi:hypothetical protein